MNRIGSQLFNIAKRAPKTSSCGSIFQKNTKIARPGQTQVRYLNLHEYQSKSLFDQFGITVQKFKTVDTAEEAEKAAKELNAKEIVVKAQIMAGGRGKGSFIENNFKGGVHLCKTPQEAKNLAKNMLGFRLKTKQTSPEGVPVRKLMIAESIDLKRELYFAILMDRAAGGPIMIASQQGGVDIETVAEKTPEAIFKEPIDIFTGPQGKQLERLATSLGFKGPQVQDAANQMKRLYELFIKLDCTQVEVNPLAETPDGKVYAVDAKINFDDNAEFRQKQVYVDRDTTEEDPREVEAAKHGLNYIGMDGNIGCMVNGAGLAMATMDIIKLYKGSPANFLDVGGGANEKQVTEAFKILTADSQVKAILVNIFGGIMKCDTIAAGIVGAAKAVSLKIPVVVRLAGTNVDLGKKILADSGLPLISASDLDDAAQKAVAAISGKN
jgi:succinyl-CoA synthetase beta subunit